MLTELHIVNFAIVDEQTIPFRPGLNVISGESGSGKSIILQALELIVGGKPKAHAVRSGAEQLEVQALFDLSGLPPETRASLPDVIDGDELLVSRTVASNGRGRVYINGRLASLGLLEEIGGKLMNICGQHHAMRLLEPRAHQELLDGYAGHQDLVARYHESFRNWTTARERAASAADRSRDAALHIAQLEAVASEIGPVEPRAGLRDELEARVRLAANAERVVQLCAEIDALADAEAGLFDLLGRLGTLVQEAQKLGAETSAAATLVQSARAELDEAVRSVGVARDRIEVNDVELEELRDRLAEVARLERKYRTNDAGLGELLARARTELATLQEPEDQAELERAAAAALADATARAAELTAARREAGAALTAEVAAELTELNMKGVALAVSLTPMALAEHGAERIELLIAANPGEPPKPLRQIASGGELARIMLVLKKLLRDRSGVNVLVFDEVDSGISGGVARAVGEKLRSLAEHSQVLCITHLAQVASLADHHLLVDKVVGERTVSVVREVVASERVDEIARMLAGYKITAASRASARELLQKR